MALQGHRPRFVIYDEAAEFSAPEYCEHGNDVKNDCPSCKTFRGMEDDDQLVEINHKWGYAWGGSGLLEVGDFVVLPSAATYTRGGRTRPKSVWVGQVTDYGSSWTGQHTRIIRRATERDIEAWAEIEEAKAMARPKRERFEPRGS